MSGNRPTHRVCLSGKRNADDRKNVYTTIGSAWYSHDRGIVSVSINPGVQVVLSSESGLVLFPADDDRREPRAPARGGHVADQHPAGYEDDSDIPF